jgi:hypothetical protein
MEKIGEYEYPTLGTFKDALDIAAIGVDKYGGITPNFMAARVLGYNVPENKASLSGVIYRRFDELSLFGLFTRDRGGLRVTDLGKETLDPYDTSKADAAKAKAIGKFPIIIKAFNQLQGQLPDSTALPGKLSAITNANWTEIKKHTENLKKLFSSAFPYLEPMQTAQIRNENNIPPGNIENAVAKTITGKKASDTETWESNDFGIWVRKDPNAIDFCLEQVEAIKAWLKYVKKKCETPPNAMEEIPA